MNLRIMLSTDRLEVDGFKGKVEIRPSRGVPKRIFDIETEPSKRSAKELADSLLSKISPVLKIEPSLMRFDKVKESMLGSHVLYQQYHEDKPISGAWLRIDIDKDGKVYNIQNDTLPADFISKAKKRKDAKKTLSEQEAQSLAIAATGSESGSSNEVLASELHYFTELDIPTLAWKVIIKTSKPVGEWKIYLDAETGAILKKINTLKLAEGQGLVFNPNPVVTLNNTTIRDNSTLPDAAYSKVALKDLDNTGFLDGPFVSTRTTSNRVKSGDHQFMFKRENRFFKEVMVYYHIDTLQRYIQDLGFKNVLNHQIAVNIDGRDDDNSHYSPATKSLTFGTGGVDDAEDAEVVAHEYGHAIQDDQVPGWGESHESGSMGEAFGDYLAASYFEEKKEALLKPTVANWDATAYSVATPPNLRRVDSNKLYPKDIVQEVHDDGEIWSACLWQLRDALGARAADTLIISHHFLLSRIATFEEAANALITADKNLNQGRNESAIRDIFIRRGIIPKNNKRAGARFEDLY
jgi:Zn-dependent metalloprotease